MFKPDPPIKSMNLEPAHIERLLGFTHDTGFDIEPSHVERLLLSKEISQAAERIRSELTKLGYCYHAKNGDVIEVSYRQLGLVGTQYGLLEVDVQRLPRRVSIGKLTHNETLHHLTAAVGKPVYKLSTPGLTYCIELQPRPRRLLPERVLLDLDAHPPGEYMIPIGQGVEGARWCSLLETSHILVGGESHSGKSTWLNVMLVALLTGNESSTLRLALVDAKGIEFTPFASLPHLVKPIATTPPAASMISSWLIAEMDRRQELFAGVFASNLQSYNERIRRHKGTSLPLIVAVIDEVSDIALQCGLNSVFYRNLIRLSSKGAAFGIVLVLATQNPKAEVLNTLIQGNMSTRIAFRVTGIDHSRTILGCSGAQKLPRTLRGRMLARLDESLVELQGFYVSDETMQAMTEGWAASCGSVLTPVEQEMVIYAQQELGGVFPIGKVYKQFKGQLSHRQLVKLGRKWEYSGWLLAPRRATDARQVTDKLWQMAMQGTGREAMI